MSTLSLGMRRGVLLVVWVLLLARALSAHPAPFSYLDLRLLDTGIEGSLVLHDFDVAHDLGVTPPERLREQAVAEQYRDQLTRLMDSRLALVVNGTRALLTWHGIEALPDRQSVRLVYRAATERPGSVRVAAALFPYDPVHQTFINVYEDSELRQQAILSADRTSVEYFAGTWQGTTAVFGVFVPAGIEHILIGPDHVLFLVGLMLLGGSLWRLTTIVTAFTIGHSVTLSLAALDVFSPPAGLVEPVIALSIVFVGADNLLVHREARLTQVKHPRDIRPWIAGVFGLVHGFGFASVLKEFGLPATALGWSLVSFNLGVEIGQLGIVLFVATVLNRIRTRSARLAHAVVVIGSALVIAAGGYWFIERVFLTGGV